MMKHVIIFDTTLRDGLLSPGVRINAGEKLRLAMQLEKLGVDAIEAGFPSKSPDDFEAVEQIAGKIDKAQVTALSGVSKGNIYQAWQAVKRAKHPRLNVFISTSDIQMEQKLKMSREEVVKTVVEAVRYARAFTENVQFSAGDGSRSDRDFICQVFEAAIEAGASTVNLPDTVGYAVPDEFGDLISYVRDHIPNINQAVLSIHCHNDLGLATANTLAGIKAGARQAEVTVNGIGERAGNSPLEEVVMNLYTRKEQMGLITGVNTREIFPTSRLVSLLTGIVVQSNKAVVGDNVFAYEADNQQQGIVKGPMTYEIMKSEMVGLPTNGK